jgi:hypothetical protein
MTDDLSIRMAQDMHAVIVDKNLRETILRNIRETEMQKLWTWEQRLTTEVNEVERLLSADEADIK